jgi:methyl-accepting chemotaxis protein
MNSLGNSKIWKRLVIGISLLLVIAWAGIVWLVVLQQQATGLKQAREFASSVNQMTIAAMTGMMITGNIGDRAVFLDQIQKTENISELHLVRGQAVNAQYGPGKNDDAKPDDVERTVLANGTPYYAVQQTDQGEMLRAVIPTLSAKNYLGKDCTACHAAPEKTVLGAVSMYISLKGINSAVHEATMKIVGVAIGMLLLVIGFIFLFINRSVSIPLAQLSNNLQQIAQGEGDLRSRLKIERRDEIGETSKAFNAFMDKIQIVVSDVKASAEQVINTARQMASSAQELTGSSDHQTEATAAMAATLQEITVSIASVSDSAGSAEKMATDAGQQSGEGASLVNDAVEMIGKISSSVGRSTDMIEELDRKSMEISSIVNVIKEIAEQTNLLALNAAIEAARAGEQGRGFSVVADEVRKLAERTTTATQEIANMIETIQKNTHDSVAGMNLSNAQVNEGMAMATRSGESLARIEESSGKVREAVNEISAALREQRAATTQLAQEVEKIARKTEKNNFLAKESSHAANNLEKLATTLKNAVDRFKC